MLYFRMGTRDISDIVILNTIGCGRLWRYALWQWNSKTDQLKRTRNADTVGALTKLHNYQKLKTFEEGCVIILLEKMRHNRKM